ncbi:EID1-like F-box protein 3 [Juglans microcarpa x Juglans regia]|uniref:EID1-like F-box protein 3 n=1 Tax=Juglans microcarpa x Juglans regia TaxID=2249226 RepID=UPI001B7F7110|nr:EID1-like F-box protein 3 [Juglans microcarpa x Juglans regia]
MSRNQRLKPNPPSQGSESAESGIFNERVLVLLFETIRWDIHTLCSASSVNRKLRAIAKRLLWREACLYRAPRMVATLANGMPNGRFCGGWHALAKLMFFCCGFESTRHFKVSQPSPGHFAKASRFSKTSGRSFLAKKCRGDLLYVSDPCEHPTGDKEDDLGIYRGVFKGFSRSKTRACLIGRQVELEERMRCPYCGARVWSMTTAGLVPKSAARRLGSHSGGLDYFVCVNGHLHGTCWLVPLSSDEDEGEGEDEDEKEEEEEEGSDGDDGIRGVDNEDRTANHMGMEFKGRGKMEMGNSLVGPHEVLVGIHQKSEVLSS